MNHAALAAHLEAALEAARYQLVANADVEAAVLTIDEALLEVTRMRAEWSR